MFLLFFCLEFCGLAWTMYVAADAAQQWDVELSGELVVSSFG